jgi:hypothetical protein
MCIEAGIVRRSFLSELGQMHHHQPAKALRRA